MTAVRYTEPEGKGMPDLNIMCDRARASGLDLRVESDTHRLIWLGQVYRPGSDDSHFFRAHEERAVIQPDLQACLTHDQTTWVAASPSHKSGDNNDSPSFLRDAWALASAFAEFCLEQGYLDVWLDTPDAEGEVAPPIGCITDSGTDRLRLVECAGKALDGEGSSGGCHLVKCASRTLAAPSATSTRS